MEKRKRMLYACLFAAVTGALGFVPPIPLPFVPVPITLQTFGVMLSGVVLGARGGFLSMLFFVALVACGVPLLSGGRGGVAVFFGPSGGFLMSWPIAACLIGFLTDRFSKRLNVGNLMIFNGLGGIVVVYLCGIPYLAYISGLSLGAAAFGSLVFLPGDMAKAVFAAVLGIRIRRAVNLDRRV